MFSSSNGFWIGVTFFILQLLSPHILFSQSAAPQLIGSTGNYSSAGGISISSSVGEAVITTTNLVGGIQLTQGFQQPLAACPLAVTLSVSPSTPVCKGTTVTITPMLTPPGAYEYNWAAGGQTTSSISVAPTTTTTYTLSFGASCTITATATVAVTPVPSPTITASADTVCVLANVLLTASGGTGYQWAGGPSGATFNVNPGTPGNHTYSVTASNNSCLAGTTHTIFAKPRPNVSVTANPIKICLGDKSSLTATGAAAYIWSSGAGIGNPVFVTPNVTTTYSVLGTNANGCSNFDTVTVILETLSVNAGPDITICPGFTAALNAIVTGNSSGAQYSWTPTQYLNDPTVPNPSANPDSTTLFIVTVTKGACVSSDSVTVFPIRTPNCIIHIYNGITPNGDNDNNTWHIDGILAFPDNRVLIFNRWGSNVWNATRYNNKDVVWKGHDSSGQELPAGTYYYIVELFDGKGGILFSESKWVELTR